MQFSRLAEHYSHQLRNRSVINTEETCLPHSCSVFHPVVQRSADQGTTTFPPTLIALLIPLESSSPKLSCSPWFSPLVNYYSHILFQLGINESVVKSNTTNTNHSLLNATQFVFVFSQTFRKSSKEEPSPSKMTLKMR